MIEDRPPLQRPAAGDVAARGPDDSGLAAEDFAALWRLALHLQACVTVAEAEAVATLAADEGWTRSPSLGRAVAATVASAIESLREREQLRSLVIRDPLTGIYNRRFMEEELARQVGCVRRDGQPLAMAMLDLDRFRDYNARYGHLAGDLVLRSLAVLLQGFCRGGDVPSRYGGDEFVFIMPGATAAQAAARLEPLRRRLAETGIHHEGRPLQPVSASIGVAECSGAGVDAVALIDSADRAMYRAKRSGGNQICVVAAPAV